MKTKSSFVPPSNANCDLLLFIEIMKNLTEGIVLIRYDDGVIVYTNERFEKLFGYKPGEMIGKNISTLNAPTKQSPEEIRDNIIKVIGATGEWHGHVENIKKNGTRFWCSANVSTFEYSAYGKVMIAIHTDITDMKNALDELTRNQILLKSILNETTDAIYVKDTEGKYLLFNPGAERFTGRRTRDVLGKDDTSIFPLREAKIIMAGDRKAMHEKKPSTYEEHVTIADGTMTTFLSTKGPVFDADGNLIGLFGIARDITDRKHKQDLLKIIKQQKKS